MFQPPSIIVLSAIDVHWLPGPIRNEKSTDTWPSTNCNIYSLIKQNCYVTFKLVLQYKNKDTQVGLVPNCIKYNKTYKLDFKAKLIKLTVVLYFRQE
jgi:hypothetical protein